jgi:site-specific DNA-methyltransferase (adenine-specific)
MASSDAQGKPQLITTDPRILANLAHLAAEVVHKPQLVGKLAYKCFSVDAVNYLAKWPDESVDMVFTDEPFGAAKTLINVNGRESSLMDTSFDWDLDVPLSMMMPWVHEAYRVLKPGGALLNCGFSEWATLYKDVCLSAEFLWKATIHCIISNPRPQARKKNFRSSHYDIWWVSKGVPKTFNFLEQQEMRNWVGDTLCPNCRSHVPMIFSQAYNWPDWIFSTEAIPGIWSEHGPLTNDPGRCHPTQKPMWLGNKLVQIFTNKGDVVVDPFMGAGTFVVAAAMLKRVSGGTDTDRKNGWKKFVESRLESTISYLKPIGG